MTDIGVLKKQMWEKMEDSPFLMIGLEGRGHSEPLTAQLDKNLADTIYFFVSRDNRLTAGGPAMAHFVSKGHDFFACIAGTVSVDNDPAMIDRLWSSSVEAWFPGGKSDPALTLLRFDIGEAELWEADISMIGRLKMMFGGDIREQEAGHHAKVQDTLI